MFGEGNIIVPFKLIMKILLQKSAKLGRGFTCICWKHELLLHVLYAKTNLMLMAWVIFVPDDDET